MSKTKSYRISNDTFVNVGKIPMTTSGVFAQAVTNASKNPSLIPKALMSRTTEPLSEAEANVIRVGVSLKDNVIKQIEDLARMTRLPNEEVIRLSLEAYIKHL